MGLTTVQRYCAACEGKAGAGEEGEVEEGGEREGAGRRKGRRGDG